MRRSIWLWFLTLTLFILVPGAVMAEGQAGPAEAPLSQLLSGQRALRKGDRGPAVASLQRLLQEQGFDPVLIDGIFGPLTERAVREAQGALGLARDGLAGVQTTAALEARIRQEPTVVPAEQVTQDDGPRKPTATLILHTAAAQEATPPVRPAAQEQFALTFNGAPDRNLLPGILERLRAHNMKATFFVTAAAANEAPDLIAQIAAEGHEIGLGGLSQAPMAGLSEREMRRQLAQGSRALAAAAGRAPAWFRPPQGLVSDRLMDVTRELGLQTTLWTNVAVTDHPDRTPAELAEGLAAAAYPGSVLMIHQDRPHTVEALGPLLDQIAAKGLTSATLSNFDLP
jgi:peptidoglycan/xylan/chitin deacetylase (PgdA/CDA1 family)